MSARLTAVVLLVLSLTTVAALPTLLPFTHQAGAAQSKVSVGLNHVVTTLTPTERNTVPSSAGRDTPATTPTGDVEQALNTGTGNVEQALNTGAGQAAPAPAPAAARSTAGSDSAAATGTSVAFTSSAGLLATWWVAIIPIVVALAAIPIASRCRQID